MYQDEFAVSEVTESTTNVIAESIYAQCNADGNEYLLLDARVDYHMDNKVISIADQQITVQGKPAPHKTTASWQIHCQWKGGSTSWKTLSELKESHPVLTAEFAVVQGTDHEPAFNWCIKNVLKKRDRKIASIRKQQARYLNRSHKFDKELPKTVKQVHALDAKNGNSLWADAISKEMESSRVAYKVLPDGKSVPSKWMEIT